jgi:hypothetical protein
MIDRGNDYLMAVKANQPTLFKQLKDQFEQFSPLSIDCQTERTRDRVTQRNVSLLESVEEIEAARGWRAMSRSSRTFRDASEKAL